MAFSFRKSKKIGPFRIGLSKGGLSVSAGVKGLRVGANSKGTYASAGIPGTGLRTMQYAKQGKPVESSQTALAVTATSTKPSCPKCGSYKGVKIKTLTVIVGLGFIVIGAFFLLVGFPIILLMGMAMVVIGPFTNGRKWMCQACHCKFEVAKQ